MTKPLKLNEEGAFFLDFLYESSDYVIIIAIIAIIGIVIGWRLNILFKTEPLSEIASTETQQEELSKTPDISYETEEEDSTLEIDTPISSDEPIKIIIVDESTWTDAAEQLAARGLISNADDLINTANELKMQDKLKCRTFYLNYNESLEKYVLILSGQLNDASPEGVKAEIIEITVPNGASWDRVAADLLSLEAISSKRDFLSTVTKLKLESKLQPGTYELKVDYSLEEIVKVLCKKI